MNPANNGVDGTGDFEHNPLEGSAVMLVLLVWTGAVALAALLFPLLSHYGHVKTGLEHPVLV